jgi:23S rRNA (guanosine2251-2'-O)-methyltransferase
MVYGRNAVLELIKSDKTVDKLYVQSGQREGSITLIVAQAIKKGVPVIEADKPKLDAMINNSAHQGVIALASEKDYCSTDDILAVAEERGEKPFILIADKIMDPHNLGAIIRTAECAGVHGIIIPKRNAAGVSPMVAKTSAGASVHLAIAKVVNIAATLEELKNKGIWIFSAVANSSSDSAVDYFEADYTLPAAIVVGNEGEGLASIIIKNSDFLVQIPMSGKIESLNVSCASAVLLYEAAKQRMTNLT